MPERYYLHWHLLVKAYRIITKSKLTANEIDYVDALLRSFVNEAEHLYGREKVTIKIHQLIHVADALRNYGPLRNVDAYEYESLNGVVVGKNTATNSPIEHLHTKVCKLMFIRPIIHSMRDRFGDVIHENHPFMKYLKNSNWSYYDEQDCRKGWIGVNDMFSYKCCINTSAFSAKYRDHMNLFLHKFKSIEDSKIFQIFKYKGVKYHSATSKSFYNESTWIVFKDANNLSGGRILFGVTDGFDYYIAVDAIVMTWPKKNAYRMEVNNGCEYTTVAVNIKHIVDQCVKVPTSSGFALHTLNSDAFDVDEITATDKVSQFEDIDDDMSTKGIKLLINLPKHRHVF